MSTSKTYQQSLADADSETRPPMLERGSYIPWVSRFRQYINRKRENQKWINKALDEGPYQFQMFIPSDSTVPKLQTAEDLQGDVLLHYDVEIDVMNLILLSIPNDIYNFVAACTSAKDMWKRVEQMSTSKTYQQSLADADSETRPPMLERGSYIPWGDVLLHYDVEIDVMNLILLSIPNDIYNFVAACTSAKDMWKRVELDMFDDLFNYLQQFEKLVNTSREKKLEKSHDPLAQVAYTGSSSKNTSSYYVTRPTSVVDYDDEYQQDDIQTNPEDPLASAMNLLTLSLGNTSTVQCYNCSVKGHYARNCPKPRVRDSKYFMEQILMANQDEAGVILTDEQNDFLFADALRLEEIKDLSANICLMARIQPTNNTYDAGLRYGSAFIWEVQSLSINETKEQMYPTHTKIIDSTIGDDQIDSNIIFDTPNGNVNSGSVEKDTHVPDLYALERLARNAYHEAEKQQIFTQKV
nr:hypothetical protein [Tanacetum cinerariifolium]